MAEPIDQKYQLTDLSNLANGAVAEKFKLALQQLSLNVQDLNTEAEAKRSIIIKLEVKPTETRRMLMAKVTIEAKLASTKPTGTVLNVVLNHSTGEILLVNDATDQGKLFEQPN